MTHNQDYLKRLQKQYVPIQGIRSPDLSILNGQDVDIVDLKTLPPDTVMVFSGTHSASHYIAQVIEEQNLGNERLIHLWYVGQKPRASFGVGNDVNIRIGCLETRVDSFQGDFRKGNEELGIFQLGGLYSLPDFLWTNAGRGELYFNFNMRLETITRLQLQFPR